MNIIETLFGISPDGGNGSTELLCIVTLLCIIALYRSREPIWKLVKRTAGR